MRFVVTVERDYENAGWLCHDNYHGCCAQCSVSRAINDEYGRFGHEKLIGAWRLAWTDEQAADGKVKHITDRQGTLLYTQDGHMSVQIMLPSAQSAPTVIR